MHLKRTWFDCAQFVDSNINYFSVRSFNKFDHWDVLVLVNLGCFSPSSFSHFHCNPMRKVIKAQWISTQFCKTSNPRYLLRIQFELHLQANAFPVSGLSHLLWKSLNDLFQLRHGFGLLYFTVCRVTYYFHVTVVSFQIVQSSDQIINRAIFRSEQISRTEKK